MATKNLIAEKDVMSRRLDSESTVGDKKNCTISIQLYKTVVTHGSETNCYKLRD